ncbi:MAG: hypothetical protein DRH17_02235 [Deltaproteobacteria bacterium]|nr:MAG: hypothetical protein DRH17_02235 [Deltaproteobacteria bacterium]
MARRKLTKLEQIGIVVMVGVVGLFFYLKLVYDPTMKKYSAIRKKWVKLFNEVAVLEDEEMAARGAEGLAERLKELEQDLRNAETTLVKDVDSADSLMINVLKVAEKNNLEVASYESLDITRVKEIIKSLFYQRRYYDVLLRGSYGDLIAFLTEISSLPQLITVEKIDIRHEGRGENGSLDVALLFGI